MMYVSTHVKHINENQYIEYVLCKRKTTVILLAILNFISDFKSAGVNLELIASFLSVVVVVGAFNTAVSHVEHFIQNENVFPP